MYVGKGCVVGPGCASDRSGARCNRVCLHTSECDSTVGKREGESQGGEERVRSSGWLSNWVRA